MSVSFTGINNIKVLKSKKQGYGLFQGADKEMKMGNMELTEVKLRFEMTDDAEGNDMTELKAALEYGGRGYSYDPRNPNQIELHLKKVDADDGVVPVSNSYLSINNQDINITKRQDLRLYTYLAKITRNMVKRPDVSSNQGEYINMINGAIHQNAMNYIDYVM